MPIDSEKIKGLTDNQVLVSRKQHGENLLSYQKENSFLKIVIGVFKEPMVILLLVAIAIYIASGDFTNGIFLAFAVVAISAISLYQDSRSRDALEELKSFSISLSYLWSVFHWYWAGNTQIYLPSAVHLNLVSVNTRGLSIPLSNKL